MSDEIYSIEVQNLVKKFRISNKENTVFDRLINIVNRRSGFEEMIVLDNVSFKVKTGEMIGVVGRNGSGKTTLLRLIAKVMRPDSGIIRTNGSIVPLLELATGFEYDLPARDNIIQYGTILGLSHDDIKDKIDDILGFAELQRFANVKIKKFSTGMLARLAFSTAAQVDPDILLVDEVLSVGDASFQQKSYKEFISFKEKKRTIVFVSHNLESLRKLCDRIIFLHDGKIESIGEPEKVIESYLNILSSQTQYANQKVNSEDRIQMFADSTEEGADGAISSIEEIRNMVDNHHYGEARIQLVKMLNKEPKNGHLNYLFAFCLHNSKIDYFRALYHYNLALEYGFHEFWVLYSRGCLYYEIGDIEAANSDLRRAMSIDPSHEGPKIVLAEISNIK